MEYGFAARCAVRNGPDGRLFMLGLRRVAAGLSTVAILELSEIQRSENDVDADAPGAEK